MNYYWMAAGQIATIRRTPFWGFVPEDHIVGKASFICAGKGFRASPLEQDIHEVK